MNQNLANPAYPCTPIQDQYNRLVVPNAGINKLEYFTLEIYKAKLSNPKAGVLMSLCIEDAIKLIELIEEKIKTPDNEKTTKLVTV